MEKIKRFHPVYALVILKKPAIVCVVPLLAALRERDLDALLRAARQEMALILALLVLGGLLWRQTGWWLENETLYWRRGFFGPVLTGSLKPQNLVFAAVVRAWYLRPIGAVRLELGLESGENRRLYLTRGAAENLMEKLMPFPQNGRDLSPAVGEKALLALLNCDLFATLVVLGVSFRNSRELLGKEWMDRLAQQGIDRTAAVLGRWMPAGMALLAAVAFLLAAATLGLAVLRTANYRLVLSDDTVAASGGLLSPTRWVIRQRAIACADLRYTPVARLTGRYPLFVTVGSFTGSALLLCRSAEDPRLRALLPTARFPENVPQKIKGRSLPAFLLAPGFCLGVSLVFYLLLLRFPVVGPLVRRLLVVPMALSLAWLWVGLEGWRLDGAALTAAGLPTAISTQGFTHHHYCLLHTPAVTLFANPFSSRVGRCNLILHLPAGKPIKILSAPTVEAAALAENKRER